MSSLALCLEPLNFPASWPGRGRSLLIYNAMITIYALPHGRRQYRMPNDMDRPVQQPSRALVLSAAVRDLEVPVTDQSAGQLEQAEVDACVMLIPGAEPPEGVQPGEADAQVAEPAPVFVMVMVTALLHFRGTGRTPVLASSVPGSDPVRFWEQDGSGETPLGSVRHGQAG